MSTPMPEIKAGYLLRVRYTPAEGEEKVIHMTGVPVKGFDVPPMVKLLAGFTAGGALKGAKDGDLGLCGDGEYWPLASQLASTNKKIEAVYGYTFGRNLLSNTTEGRELLWESSASEEPEKMTLAEIEAKLGHPVEIVQ